LTPATLANYVPPDNQEAPSDYSKSGGIRAPEQIPLTILAPTTYIGQTISQFPTFVWFVPNLVNNNICGKENVNPEIEFQLYEYESKSQPKAIGDSILLPAQSGIMSLSWPENQQELVVGQNYFWQVTLLCQYQDRLNNEEGIYTTAVDLKVVETPADVEANLASSASAVQRADIYADSGLWYDAMAQALSLTNFSKLSELGASYLQDLANSENLGEKKPQQTQKNYEIQKRKVKERNEDLRKIAIQEK
jgi:hypothetical protein